TVDHGQPPGDALQQAYGVVETAGVDAADGDIEKKGGAVRVQEASLDQVDAGASRSDPHQLGAEGASRPVPRLHLPGVPGVAGHHADPGFHPTAALSASASA